MPSPRLSHPLSLATLLVSSVALSAVRATPQQEPTFKGENRTVAVYTTVTDATGRLVPDLPRDAFTVVDERKPQTLTLFANDIQPITVVVMLDRSGSMRSKFALVERAA